MYQLKLKNRSNIVGANHLGLFYQPLVTFEHVT